MVRSQLNPEIDYNENTDLDSDDQELDTSVWNYELLGNNYMVAVGSKNNKESIDYFPIYLIKHDKVVSKIGVFEMINADDNLDAEGDLDFNKVNDPLLFSFVNSDYLQTIKNDFEETAEVPVKEQSDMQEKETTPKSNASKESDNSTPIMDGVFMIDSTYKEELLDDQTKEVAENEREIIKSKDEDKWVCRFLENRNFEINDVESDGSCLFYVIRDGMNSVGRKITVEKIRKLLANEATEELFDTYRTMFRQNKSILDNLKLDIEKVKKEYDENKSEFEKTMNREKKLQFKNLAKEKNKVYENLMKQRSEQMAYNNEFKIMDGVESLDKFKEVIQTCNFWADHWAISTLERVLNIKIIIFDYTQYQIGALDNVIQCGILDDPILLERGEFKPDYYILTNYLGRHYQSISYKNKKALKFNEILWTIREKIVEKCLETSLGPYGIIPEFKEFKESLQLKDAEPVKSDVDDSINLYDNDVEFLLWKNGPYYKTKIGRVDGEVCPKEKQLSFSVLNSHEFWRRKLSNMFVKEFMCHNKRWNSIEHYIQANKFKNQPEYFNQFALDSNSDLSKDPNFARSFGNNKAYKGVNHRPSGVTIDNNYNESEAYLQAIKCKVKDDDEFKEILIATKRAKLLLKLPRETPRVQKELMSVRKSLL